MNKILSILFLFALVFQVNGWLDTGHMLVSQIAYKHLKAAGVSSDLWNALNNAIDSLVTYSSASNTFVTAACWMDDLKFRNLNQFNSWHYVDLPICDYNDTYTDDCTGTSVGGVLATQNNAVWAINMAIATTSNATTAKGLERGFALRNLLHIVGDLHQPLHAASMFSANTPRGDLGGNLFPITGIPGITNLHFLWDSGINQLTNTLTRPLNSSASSYISDMADQIIAKTASLTQNETAINVTAWALESYQLAMMYAYNLSFNSTPSAEYMAASWEVAQNQIGLGGYRLHLILKQFALCTDGSCPESEENMQEKETIWFIVGIVLACALGVSIIVNIILIVRARRVGYENV